MTLNTGTKLGPYEILSSIGAGGMGEVYRARDPRLGRDVAIKVLPASLSADADRLRRFEQEARAAGILNHPNITAVYDAGSSALAGGRLSPRKAIDYSLQIVRGLAAAHDKGIVHRDLKPENIFVAKNGRIKILDFGLAKLVQGGEPSSERTDLPTESAGTEPGVVMGTLGYMAPEQVRGQPADIRSDIFAFGAILYEMLSGRRAFQGQSAADTMSAILKEDPPALSVSGGALPPVFDSIIRHCLEKSPDARFRSAHDLAFALQEIGPSSLSGGFPEAARVPRRKGVVAIAAVAAAAVLLVVAALVVLRRPRESAGEGRKSVAVLPFVNMSSDKENEYFSDGITEDLITALSKVSGLRVAARTSSFAFKGKNEDIRAIGRQLGVGTVLEGSVAKAGNRVRITAQLINTADGYHLWSETYDRDLQDIFAVRSQLAQTVASALKVRLFSGERQSLEKKPTEDLEAYQLYLKGRHEISSYTAAGLENGIRHLQEALARDPHYALAHLGMAYYYISICDTIPGKDALPRARAAAEKALELDPTLAEAQADLAFVRWLDAGDPAVARREFEAALRLQPDLAFAHELYGWYLGAVEETDRGVVESRRAVELDPLSPETNAFLGINLYVARRYDEAIRQLRTTIAIDPNYFLAHEVLGRVYAGNRKWPEALGELETARRLAGFTFWEIEAPIGLAHAARGNRAEAQKILDRMLRPAPEQFVPSYHVGVMQAGLGQADQAFQSLEKSREERSYWNPWLHLDPYLDVLHSDPRWPALVKSFSGRP